MEIEQAAARLDELAASVADEELVDLIGVASVIAGVPVAELVHGSQPAVVADAAAWARLDRLGAALRALATQPPQRFARDTGGASVAVVASWPRPARALALHAGVPGGAVLLVVLLGHPGSDAEAWRLVLEDRDTDHRQGGLLADGRALVETMWA